MISSFLVAAAVLGLGASEPVSSQPAGATNVVLIMTDDQGAWSLGCYGNPEAKSPAIDRLAAEGVRLSNAFAAIPVCSPSRATFFTGRIPSQHGIHDWIRSENAGPRERYCLPNEVLISDILAKHGYTCGLVGKWHLGDSMKPHASYSYWFAMPWGGSKYQNAEMVWEGKIIKTKGYVTDRITDRAIKFIDANRQRPFFLTVTYNAPHTPYTGHPQELVDLYRDCPFNSIPKAPLHPWATGDYANIGKHDLLAKYFAACTGADRGVGRIVEHIDKAGLGERTLIIFTSDQGFCVGHHGLWGKGNASNPRNIYDTSLQIPMIFRHTGRLPKGRSCDGLFSAYDLVPTLLEYLKLPPSPGRNLPGYAMTTMLEEPKPGQGHPSIFAEYGRARMIRTREWKYIRYPEIDDLDEKNLGDLPEYRKQKMELRGKLIEWFNQYAEAGADPVGEEYFRPSDK